MTPDRPTCLPAPGVLYAGCAISPDAALSCAHAWMVNGTLLTFGDETVRIVDRRQVNVTRGIGRRMKSEAVDLYVYRFEPALTGAIEYPALDAPAVDEISAFGVNHAGEVREFAVRLTPVRAAYLPRRVKGYRLPFGTSDSGSCSFTRVGGRLRLLSTVTRGDYGPNIPACADAIVETARAMGCRRPQRT